MLSVILFIFLTRYIENCLQHASLWRFFLFSLLFDIRRIWLLKSKLIPHSCFTHMIGFPWCVDYKTCSLLTHMNKIKDQTIYRWNSSKTNDNYLLIYIGICCWVNSLHEFTNSISKTRHFLYHHLSSKHFLPSTIFLKSNQNFLSTSLDGASFHRPTRKNQNLLGQPPLPFLKNSIYRERKAFNRAKT